jgi:hypothetical protein
LLELMGNEQKVAEEYCWVITHAVRWSCCGRLCCCVLEVAFEFDCLAHTDIINCTYNQFPLAWGTVVLAYFR